MKTDLERDLGEKFFTVRAPEAWNKLPDSVVGASSVVSLKRLLDAYF